MKLILTLVLIFIYISFLNSLPLILVKKYDSQDNCLNISTKCKNEFLIGGTILKTSTCLYYQNNPSIFTINYEGNIVQTIYNERKCKEFKSNKIYQQNECKTTCKDYQQQTTQMYIVDDIDIPLTSIIHVSYSDECNKDFKNSFNRIDYEFINYCINSGSVSTLSTCNSTAQIINTYKGSNCNGVPISSTLFPFVEDCDEDNNNNYLQFCN